MNTRPPVRPRAELQPLGDAIYRARVAKGLTQKQLGEQVGMTQTTIYGIEAGRREPGILALQKIARELGCGIGELMGERR